MKNISKITIWIPILLGLMLASCEEEDAANDVNTPYITTSFGDQQPVIQVNGVMSFIDLSRGITSREWIFPDNTLTAEGTVLEKATAQTVKAQFTIPGEKNITLKQTYGSNVWVDGSSLEGNTYEKTLLVTVLDSVRATFQAVKVTENETLTNENDAKNEVIAGRVVQFSSTATGPPTTHLWTISRKDGFHRELTASEPTFKFSVPGLYDISYNASNDFGNNIVKYENYIEVIGSSDPVTLDMVERSSPDEIGLVFSRSMQDPSDCPLSAFNVTITNNGVDVSVDILSVSGFENIVKIKLSDKIYNSDLITVSYDASVGDLITEDGMLATSSTDVQLTDFKVENILATSGYDTGFEKTTEENWPYLWWGAPWDQYTLEVNTVQAHSGVKSCAVTMNPNGGMIIGHKDEGGNDITFALEEGKSYTIGLWIYVESLGDQTSIPDLRFYWTNNTDWGVDGVFFDTNFPVGKWIYQTIKVDSPGAGDNGFQIRGDNQNNSRKFKCYIDDLAMFVHETRP